MRKIYKQFISLKYPPQPSLKIGRELDCTNLLDCSSVGYNLSPLELGEVPTGGGVILLNNK